MATTCRRCATANDDYTRACTACGEALERRCPACDGLNAPQAMFCGRCGGPIDDASLAAAKLRSDRLKGYLPTDLAERFLQTGSALLGEQREVTTLFVDIAESTLITRSVGAERMASLLDDVLESIARMVFRFEGTVVDFAGDGALCVFGAPIAHEDDPERALRAALAIRQVLIEIRSPAAEAGLATRIGVNSGSVVVRALGKDLRLKYSAVGDAVVLAQRLQTAAQPGDILVAESTRRQVEPLFDFGPKKMLPLKGFAQDEPAYLLLGDREALQRRQIHPERVEMVARDRELADVTSCFSALAGGSGGVLSISGDAGIGKSRLLLEARASAPRGIVWLEGRAVSYGQTSPYLSVSQQIRRAAGITTTDDVSAARAKVRALIEEYLGQDRGRETEPFIAAVLKMPPTDDEARLLSAYTADSLQTAVLRSLRDLLIGVADRTPVALIYEDLHWSDAASIGVIESLLPLVDEKPVLFVLVARPDTEAPSWSLRQKVETRFPHRHTVVTLAPLGKDGATEIARQLLDVKQLPAEVSDFLHSKAEGVPLYVEELTNALVEEGALVRFGLGWALAKSAVDLKVPPTLQGIILARIDRLADPVKRTLQLASVVGRTFTLPVLEKAARGRDGLDQSLKDLQRLGFIREARRQPVPEYTFRHALIQDVAYRGLLGAARTELHRSVGAAIEELFPERLAELSAVIGEHWLRAQDWERAAAYFNQAGDAAARLYAYAEARGLYDNAITALEKLPTTLERRRTSVDTIVKRVAVSFVAEDPATNIARLTKAEPLARDLANAAGAASADRARLAKVHYWLGRVNVNRGQPREAIEYFRQMLPIAKELGDENLAALPSAVIGTALTVQGQWSKACALLSTALPTLERSGDWTELIRFEGYYGAALSASGDYAGGVREGLRALTRARELNHLNGIGVSHILLCVSHLLADDPTALLATAQGGIEAAERAGDRLIEYGCRAFAGWALSRLGEPAEAAAQMARSTAIAAALGSRLILSDWFAVARAELALNAERPEEALLLVKEADAAADLVGSVFTKGFAHEIQARAMLALKKPDLVAAAEERLAAARAAMLSGDARLPAAHVDRFWGLLLRDRGDQVGAREHLSAAVDVYKRAGATRQLELAERELEPLMAPNAGQR